MSALRFDVDREIARSVSAQCVVISTKAQDAVHRLYWMHAVGSGICGCGGDMQGHPVWDDHSPTELPIDKSEECPHETFDSRYIGRGVYRHECHDCGEINNVDAKEWGE